MKVEELHKKYSIGLKDRVVCYFVKDGKVLLAYKKVRFGKGKTIGIGGKVEDGESLEDAVIRECQEEVSLTPVKFHKTALIYYYFPEADDPEGWNQKMYAYICTEWEGEPAESEEMKPMWFDIDSLPVDKMWDDAKYWVPKILQGEKLEGQFAFDKDLIVSDYKILDLAVS